MKLKNMYHNKIHILSFKIERDRLINKEGAMYFLNNYIEKSSNISTHIDKLYQYYELWSKENVVHDDRLHCLEDCLSIKEFYQLLKFKLGKVPNFPYIDAILKN